MRRGFMGMMLKPRCNRRSGWGKGLFDPPPKKTRMNRSKIKVLLVVSYDWKGIVHHEFVPRGQMGNKQLYQEVLALLRDAVRRMWPELWENQIWMLHHNNAPAHASLLIRSYLAKRHTSLVPHPPYSPDLAPADFFLFLKLKPLRNSGVPRGGVWGFNPPKFRIPSSVENTNTVVFFLSKAWRDVSIVTEVWISANRIQC